ncbi:MAG: septation protein SpoVG family protein [Nitrospinae bacterium]|nr:septation protein SpoVG family protein [Nitrospinota bacterium]
MIITSVKIYPFDTTEMGGMILAFAEVVLDDVLLLKGIKVMEGKGGGLFISYPSQKGKDNQFHDLVVPLDEDLKKQIRRAVVDAFKASDL